MSSITPLVESKVSITEMVWSDGRCWFTQAVDGVQRSSYLGYIGRLSVVEAWCVSRGIKFSVVKSFAPPVPRLPHPGKVRERGAGSSPVLGELALASSV